MAYLKVKNDPYPVSNLNHLHRYANAFFVNDKFIKFSFI